MKISALTEMTASVGVEKKKGNRVWVDSTRLDSIGRCCNSLQKKVHAVLLFTAIELPFALLPRAFFELWRAINYAISDIAWRTIFCTLYSAFSSVNDSCFMCFDTFLFLLHFVFFFVFGEGNETVYDDSGRWLIRGHQPWFHHQHHCRFTR